ncbi:P-loop containing nucleoside triphosphate hydrolase protein [Endogone sp. FLAS-F59071]|nr:P-loop containing nucleoside triphosphate hydrolase protein [Endogone sp. FLAS-F59071]|eukprot:RUS19596.1 P-loop containing nucleoside triphosphate hydrolase protein [Endogone sp. FLAS-F59071]
MTSTSTRSLQRLPEDLTLSAQQLSKLSALSIYTTKDLLSKTDLELVELCDWDPASVREVTRRVARWIAPGAENALQMYRAVNADHSKSAFFRTELELLDRLLGGGIPCSTVTEIVGPSGCGKTQICLTLTVLAASALLRTRNELSPSDHTQRICGVVYIDTEGAFSSQRLVEIACIRFPDLFAPTTPTTRQNLQNLTESVHIIPVQNSHELIQRLESLQSFIITHHVRLIVLDSVASLVRREFAGDTTEERERDRNRVGDRRGAMWERSELLVREAATLKFLAESFHIPVVVTNQVTTKFGEGEIAKRMRVREEGENEVEEGEEKATSDANSFVAAALGNTWAHSVTTRLVVEYAPTPASLLQRRVRIAKSPMAPRGRVAYRIEASGVVQADDGVGSGIDANGVGDGLERIRTR